MIKDRLKLANELRQRGHDVPQPDSDAYYTTVATLLMDPAVYESLNDHFEPALGDVGASNQDVAPQDQTSPVTAACRVVVAPGGAW